MVVDRPRAVLHDIFRTFLGARECGSATGNYPLDHRRIRSESRGTFACVQHAEPPRCPCANVEKAASGAEGRLGKLDGAGYLLALRRYGIGNTAVFGVYEVYDLERGCEI